MIAFLLTVLSLGLLIYIIRLYHIPQDEPKRVFNPIHGFNTTSLTNLKVNGGGLSSFTMLLNNYQIILQPSEFMNDCLLIGKPCKFSTIARNWAILNEWRSSNLDGSPPYEQMLKVIGKDNMVDVYFQQNPSPYNNQAEVGFRNEKMIKMKYEQFLILSTRVMPDNRRVVLRDESLTDVLLPLIEKPYMFEGLMDPERIVLIQHASLFETTPKYERKEQFLCSIEGLIQIKLIHQIYYNEVYAGQEQKSELTAETQKYLPNESPVNFFEPDFQQFPLFNDILRRYTVILHEGDCLFIPAFYFHKYAGRKAQSENTMGIAIVIEYKSHSQLLNGFYDAIEAKMFT